MLAATAAKTVAQPARDWLRALERTARLENDPHRTLPAAVAELGQRFPGAPALLSSDETFTFSQLADRSARYGAWAAAEGLAPGDVVALLMPNRPEYLAAWLGLTGVGVVAALVNPALRGPSLTHSLRIARPRRIIVDVSLERPAAEALNEAGLSDRAWSHGAAETDWPRLDVALREPPAAASFARPTLSDRALLIYTSGTTGLPKAAIVSHRRIMSWSAWFGGLMDITPQDRLYDCLPLCHSAGGVAAVGAALVSGASTVVAPRFSAQRFWDDIADWDCTLIQYIGELCRYLLAAPSHPRERAHRLRLACGNGLMEDDWRSFQARFDVPRVLEFYASTEGAFSLFNVEGHPGAIGRIPAFMAHRFPAEIVRYDRDAEAPFRSADGRCVRCRPGEVGEAIGRLSGGGAGRFEGYSDPAASEAKLLRDVFEAGDAWMRTGDLMRQDEQRFFYFVDRVGDTFRWKGENVSISEVAAALRRCPGVRDVCVYGVGVPGAPGKAGMAALVTGPQFEFAILREHLADALPEYAWPVFVRLQKELERTETFKLKKGPLAADGWDLTRIADPVYIHDRAAAAYAPLTREAADRIRTGALRL